jgi:predicted nuclease with TOPRIM domain
MSDLIELLLHLDGRNRAIGCKAADHIKELEHWLECERGRADNACAELKSETDAMNTRIRELEAERDKLSTELTGWIDLAEKWQDERDAIEAATIERCLKICLDAGEEEPEPTFSQVADRIRALKSPEKE